MAKIREGRTERGRYWRRWLEKWRRSSLTQAEFCRRHGLKVGNFSWWKRKLDEPAELLRPISRRGVSLRSIAQRPLGRESAEFVELTAPVLSTPPSRCSAGYEVILPRGAVIRLPVDFDPDRVRQLISAAAWVC